MSEFSDSLPQPDRELLQRMAAGEVEALGLFYDRHSTLLYSLCLEILGDESEAGPNFVEAMGEIWKKAAGYDPSIGPPLSWALAIIQQGAVRRLRVLRLAPPLLESAPALPLFSASRSLGKPPVSGTAHQPCLRGVLSRLPDHQRLVIELSYFCGLTPGEIASQLGEPLLNVKCRIRQGMMALRDSMEEAR